MGAKFSSLHGNPVQIAAWPLQQSDLGSHATATPDANTKLAAHISCCQKGTRVQPASHFQESARTPSTHKHTHSQESRCIRMIRSERVTTTNAVDSQRRHRASDVNQVSSIEVGGQEKDRRRTGEGANGESPVGNRRATLESMHLSKGSIGLLLLLAAAVTKLICCCCCCCTSAAAKLAALACCFKRCIARWLKR